MAERRKRRRSAQNVPLIQPIPVVFVSGTAQTVAVMSRIEEDSDWAVGRTVAGMTDADRWKADRRSLEESAFA